MGGWAAWYVNYISTELFLKGNTEGRLFADKYQKQLREGFRPHQDQDASRLGVGCSDGGDQRLLIWSMPPLSMLLRFWVSLRSNKPLCSSHPILPPGSHNL